MQPEKVEHINVVNWFAFHFPELEDDFHHFANERRCSVQEGRMLKRMGVKKGVADFFLAFPVNGYAGLWLEQQAFAERKISRGYQFAFVWGREAAQEMIKAYLKEYSANRSGTIQISCT